MSWGNKSYSSASIFPLTKMSLLNLTLPAPRDTRSMLTKEYGDEFDRVCKTHFWNHREEKAFEGETLKINCSDLAYLFRFEKRALPAKNDSMSRRKVFAGGEV